MKSANLVAHGMSVQGCFSAMWYKLNENTRQVLCKKAGVQDQRINRMPYADITNLMKAVATLAETSDTIRAEQIQTGRIKQAGAAA